ncbi:SdrD B-like domain-containing protein [Chondromyces apiculatus]|nr:SdrD B-like domain-containing protein [Chondromyces apiculatus]
MRHHHRIAKSATIASLLASSVAMATAAQASTPSTPSTPSSGCVTIKRGVRGNVYDTFIWDVSPGHNEGTYVESFTGTGSGGGEKRALFGFDVSPIPARSVVSSAKFYAMISSNYAQPVRAHQVLAPWQELEVTWANLGAIDPTVAGSFISGGWSKWVNIDLTPVVQSWVNGDAAANGILLEEGTSSSTSYKTSDHTNLSYRPYLEVCYSEPKASIGTTVWFDGNADGFQDEGELGISGVTLDLFKDASCVGQAAGSPVATTITDGSGNYRFNGLNAGCYVVSVDDSTLPSGHVLTSIDQPLAVEVAAGEELLDADFGYVTISSIGDMVWRDSDGDGAYEPEAGELGLNGVLVELYRNGNLVDFTVTGNSPYTGDPGFYLFDSLMPATYTVKVSQASFEEEGLLVGMEPTADLDGGFDNAATVVLGTGVDFLDADFGYQTSCGNGECQAGEDHLSCAIDCGPPPAVCGNESCELGEDCSSCSADCGSCPPVCGNGSCESGENCATCADDCGSCPVVCGNGSCEAGESCSSCSADCGSCPPVCGNGSCEAGEDCNGCAADCGACPAVCGNDQCEATESCSNCPSDCGLCPAVCGNGACELGESCSTCSKDCGTCAPVCGNGVCNSGEDCSSCSSDCGACPAAPQGTCNHDYWKNHPSSWPVCQRVLGQVSYTIQQLITMLKHPTTNDMTYELAKELLAAKLNVGAGNPSGCIEGTIVAADAWLKLHPVGSNVKRQSLSWLIGAVLTAKLDLYNDGKLCAPRRKN